MNRLACVFFAVFVFFSCAGQEELQRKYPVLGRDTIGNVAFFENHSEALVQWAKKGIRNAVLVNIDTHDDIRWIPAEKIEKLKCLYEKKDRAAIKEVDSVGDESLFNIGNFIYAAAKLGIIKEVYWIIPFAYFSKAGTENHLKIFLKTYNFSENDIKTFRMKDGCFCGIFHEVPLNICGIEALPDIKKPVILSIDVDFFPPMAREYGIDKMSGIKVLFDALYKKKYSIQDALIAYSVNGGYLRVINRWIGNQSAEVLRKPDMIYGTPPELWTVRQNADIYYEENKADLLFELTQRYLEKYQNEPSLMMYIAFAYYGTGNIEKAFDCAKKACLINSGYCFGLADIGQCLIDDDMFPDAVKFFESAYSLCPGMNYRQKGFANALRKAGQYREALKYYEAYRSKNGSFPVDFLMGEIFFLMGDEESALKHFNRGRRYLKVDPYAFVKYQIDADAILSAIKFYEKRGFDEYARELKKNPKLKAMF
jgi:tetratricopeptide (TPR) repeat protein